MTEDFDMNNPQNCRLLFLCFVTIIVSICVAGCDTIEQQRTNGHDSVDAAQDFVKKYPNNPDAYAALGDAWYDRGEYRLAIKYHKKALHINNQSAETHSELGDDYILLGQKRNARAEWKRALSLDNHVPPTETRLHAEKMLEKYL